MQSSKNSLLAKTSLTSSTSVYEHACMWLSGCTCYICDGVCVTCMSKCVYEHVYICMCLFVGWYVYMSMMSICVNLYECCVTVHEHVCICMNACVLTCGYICECAAFLCSWALVFILWEAVFLLWLYRIYNS